MCRNVGKELPLLARLHPEQRGSQPRDTLNGKLGGPKRRSGRFGEEMTLLALSETELRFVQPSRYTHYGVAAP
jgi:hypothetical protein